MNLEKCRFCVHAKIVEMEDFLLDFDTAIDFA